MTARNRTKRFGALFFVFTSFLIGGCNANNSAPPPAQRTDNRQEDVEHRVQYSGETLQVISAWYTGRGSNWQLIRAANPGLRPERINIGKTIIIPGNLVVERRPMPQNFLRDALNKVPARRPETNVPADVGTTTTQQPPTNTGDSGDSVVKDTTPPADGTTPSDEVDLDAILKQQIEEQKKGNEPVAVDPTPNPTPPPAAQAGEPVKEEPKAEKADAPAAHPDSPAAEGDAEREKLLDELLTQ